MNRTAAVTRKTAETNIRVAINLDGTGQAKLASGIGFLDHMLDQIARHGLIDLEIKAGRNWGAGAESPRGRAAAPGSCRGPAPARRRWPAPASRIATCS